MGLCDWAYSVRRGGVLKNRTMNTTLNKIKAHNPCESGYQKLLNHLGKTEADDEPLPFMTILESNDIEDAIWSLRTCEDQRAVRLFACGVAESVLHIYEKKYPSDKRPRKAIDVSRKYANGEATKEELAAAWDAAWDAAWAAAKAAWAAACAAASDAVSDAASAAWAAAQGAAKAAAGAAGAAAWDAAWVAARSALDAAWDAEREKQVELFKKYFG